MKPTEDEFNIACDMEPVSVFDATSHTNSKWDDELYATWDDVPEDLQWLAKKIQNCHGRCQKTLLGYVNSGSTDFDGFEFRGGANPIRTKAQWQRARELYLQQQPAPEWKDGKPPVGVECEYYRADIDRWVGCTTIGMFRGEMICAPDGGDFLAGKAANYRPILTEAQKAEQERQEAIRDLAMKLKAAHNDLRQIAIANDYQVLAETAYKWHLDHKDTNND